MTEALIFIGCPQIPVQSPLVLYIADFLRDAKLTPVVAANPSAKQLVKVSDPKGHYVSEYRDLEKTVAEMSEGKVSYPLIISLVHNDAGLTFTATAAAVSPTSTLVTIFFGEHAYELADEAEFETEKIAAPLTHNVRGIIPHLEEVLEWAVSKV
ncbi:MAG TPA: DUF1890 domain-containing protein [Methanocorpusculum sp.]|nr:DUF1890 domain-containing protein [Methanocorpusculum sp.]